MFAPKVVPCPLPVARKSARWERSATIEVRRLTGELRATGLTLADIAVELGASARQLTAWRSGENQPPHWALLALRALLEERKRFGPSRGHRDTEESARPLAVQAQVSGTAGETAPISREAA